MKNLFLATVLLVLSIPAMAQVFPTVYNNRTSVQLTAWNHTAKNYMCSGRIYLNFVSNKSESIYVHEYLWARQNIFRTYYPMDRTEIISTVSSAVYCH